AAQLPTLLAPTLVHRDYYYSQLLFEGDHLSLIDFDLTTIGDPAIDVANFVAHLSFLGLDRLENLHALAPQAERFLEAYAFIHGVDVAFLERFAFYRAATLFRLLHVIAPRPALAHHFYTLYNYAACHLEYA
ncbi:MAG TPA: phosphotransferase, partial [Anaerolineales bacterium]|nr:phosphotransferase [Anaerolineales bacterium]